MVYHSHNYTVYQEFRRYFDLGIFFAKERWLLEEFGKPESEGAKFLGSEWSFLLSQGLFYLLPVSVLRAAAKLLGYRLGLCHEFLPVWALKTMSMHGVRRSSV
jgi:rhamnosyltransferase